MDKVTYEIALNTLLALEKCVDKAILELEELAVDEVESDD